MYLGFLEHDQSLCLLPVTCVFNDVNCKKVQDILPFKKYLLFGKESEYLS